MSSPVLAREKQTARPSRLDLVRLRADFPILRLTVNGKPLAYLDNAASSQMPQPVLDRLTRYQTQEHSNIHRAVHYLSETATAAYEEARRKIQRFINAREEREVIYTRGTTDAINLVMHSFGRAFLKAGDEIILSQLEHHSNIVPWQMLRDEKGCKLRVIPCNDAGELLQDQYEALFNERTKLVADHARIQCARHGEPRQADDRACTQAGGTGAGRWRAGGAASSRRRAGLGLRLLLLLGP